MLDLPLALPFSCLFVAYALRAERDRIFQQPNPTPKNFNASRRKT